MNDHNLDDLIIDTIAPKNNKTKSLLTIIALLIVVLIVAIILTKTLLKSPEESELSFEENLTTIIAPELKLQETTEVAKPKEESETSLSTIIEEEVTPPTTDVEKPETEIKEESTVQDEVLTLDTEEEIEKITEPLQEEVSRPEVKSVPTPLETKPVEETPKAEPKKIVEPVTKPAEVQKTVVRPKSPQTSGKKYYVQVSSFKQNPSQRFMAVIKSSGFSYHISAPDTTGYKKLLIGPYDTRAQVDEALAVVRDRIHKSAFVVQK